MTTVEIIENNNTLNIDELTSVNINEDLVNIIEIGTQGPAGTTDHLLLANIGVNTHDQIDTHIADGGIHGDVFKVGTPLDNEIGVWTGDGTIEGDPNFTWDGNELHIESDAAGVGDVRAIDIAFASGAIDLGQNVGAILANIDQFGATGGNIIGLGILTTEGSADVYGLVAGTGVNPILQLSGILIDADSILVNAVDELTDLSDGGAGNVDIFVADDDTMTIGSAAMFETIEFLLDTISSGAGIAPVFEFSIGVGTWDTFTPVDGTNGMRNSGIIQFLETDIPTWAVGTGTEFLIRITRTRNFLSIAPIADKVQISAPTLFSWDADGNINANTVAAETISVGSNLTHSGDTDTGFTFTSDRIVAQSGGLQWLDAREAAADRLTLGSFSWVTSLMGNVVLVESIGLLDIQPGTELIINDDSEDVNVTIEGNNDSALFTTDGGLDRVGVGVGLGTHAGKLHVDQASATGAIPTLVLDQADISEGFINFIGSDRGTILGASTQSIRVEINGNIRTIKLFADQ